MEALWKRYVSKRKTNLSSLILEADSSLISGLMVDPIK